MNYAILNETTLIRAIYAKIAEINLPVVPENPNDDAVFPCIVMQMPLSRPIYMGAAWDISVTLEIWGDELYDLTGDSKGVADYFTELKTIMLSLNFQCVNQMPAFRDIMINKMRYGGYFESRWNSTTNNFERKK